MQGTILKFDEARGEGIIAAANGARCTFDRQSWSDRTTSPVAGLTVDFVPDGDAAREIYPVKPTAGAALSPADQPANNGGLLAGLSIGAVLLGLWFPGLGSVLVAAGLVFGVLAQRQATATGNLKAKRMGRLGVIMAVVVFALQILALVFLGAMFANMRF